MCLIANNLANNQPLRSFGERAREKPLLANPYSSLCRLSHFVGLHPNRVSLRIIRKYSRTGIRHPTPLFSKLSVGA